MKNLENLSINTAINRIIVPHARNFESVDAFLVGSAPFLEGARAAPSALLFQMTVGESHPTKLRGGKKIMKKIRKDLSDTNVECAIVFVVPDDLRTFYEAPQPILKNDGSVRVQRDSDFNEDNQYCLVIEYNS